jgi:hypothetical protein
MYTHARRTQSNEAYEKRSATVRLRTQRDLLAELAQPRPKGSAPPTVQTAIDQERGGGQPLPATLLSTLEGKTGSPLDNVMIHTDERAANLARLLGAKAFTTGNDIFFNPAHYDPESKTGQSLLEHEVSHVMQQRSGEAAAAQHNDSAYDALEARANEPLHAAAEASVKSTTSTAPVQRDWLDSIMPGVGVATGLANMLAPATKFGKLAGPAGSALGVGSGIYDFATANTRSDQVQAGADTLASGAGFFGPVGTAFSTGYAGGQLLDQGVDWIGDMVSGNSAADHSISGAAADTAMDVLGPGPGLWLADTFGL